MTMNKHLILIFVLFLIPPLIIPSLTYAQNNQTLEEMLKNAIPKVLNPAPVNFTTTLSHLSPFPLAGGPLVEVEYQTSRVSN